MRTALVLVLLVIVSVASAAEVSPPALELWKEAMDYHRAKDAGRALDAFLKAYRADPAVLGLESEGLLDRSVDHLRAELNVKKDDLVYTFKLAEVQNLKGNLPEAIANYKKVVGINPNSPLAQRAADEARKLEGFQQALAPPSPASPMPAPPTPATTPPAPVGATLGLPPASSPESSPDPEASPAEDSRVSELEKRAKAAEEETAKVQEELDRLKEAHAKLQAEYEKAKYYQTLFFANPVNVENLNKGKVK